MSKALFLYILRILLNSHAKTLPLSPRRRALIIPCLFTLLSLHFSTFLLLQTCAQYWQGNEKLKKYSSRRVSSTICRGDTDTEFFCRFMKNYPNIVKRRPKAVNFYIILQSSHLRLREAISNIKEGAKEQRLVFVSRNNCYKTFQSCLKSCKLSLTSKVYLAVHFVHFTFGPNTDQNANLLLDFI